MQVYYMLNKQLIYETELDDPSEVEKMMLEQSE